MIKIAGCWELGWSTPIMEFDLWAFPLKEYEVDEFIMTPISGINKRVTEYENIDAVIKANPNMTPVFVDEKGKTEICNFIPPENPLYILGKASYSPMMNKNYESVKIQTPNHGGRLWPHQAIILLLDKKHGCNTNR